MKYAYFLLCLCIVVVSCNNSGKQEADSNADTAIAVPAWEATLNDSTGKMEMNRTIPEGPDSLNVAAVIRYLNSRNTNVQVQFVRQSGDTVFLSIPEATYLTQQMGSTGPEMFFAESVYNLTEIPGVRFVRYDFEEGDHAQPGVFTRDSFKDE